MNKRIFLPIVLLMVTFVTTSAYAIVQQPSGKKWSNRAPLDKVSMQLSAEQWASTDTALVTVTVDASLGSSDLATIHDQVTQNLTKLSPNVQWHVTQFDRSQGQSGLEQVTIKAQARIPDTNLANIRTQAKAISKPGEKYDISDIAYVPSLAEIEKVKQGLREKIYNSAKAELARLNQVYPQQNFKLYRIRFMYGATPQSPQPRTMVMAVSKMDASAASLPVSNKVIMTAKVVFAAKQ